MKFLSWNIQWGRGADGVVDIERSIAAMRKVGPLDVICLQEVARNWPGLKGLARAEDTPQRLAAAFPQFQTLFAAGVERGDAEAGTRAFGNLLLSRERVGQIFRHMLPAPADPGVRSMQRVCLEVVIEGRVPGLRVLTTHLEYYSARQRLAQVEALRTNQLEALEGVTQRVSRSSDSLFGVPPRPEAAILCGDFNFAPDSSEYQRMCSPGSRGVPYWVDAWRAARGVEPHADTVGLHGAEWPEQPYCCDYFFVTPALADRVRRIEVLADTSASDHQPVLLELDAA